MKNRKMKVHIEDACDGFAIIVGEGEDQQRFNFDQEDTRKGLVKVFKALGINAEYEEVY